MKKKDKTKRLSQSLQARSTSEVIPRSMSSIESTDRRQIDTISSYYFKLACFAWKIYVYANPTKQELIF